MEKKTSGILKNKTASSQIVEPRATNNNIFPRFFSSAADDKIAQTLAKIIKLLPKEDPNALSDGKMRMVLSRSGIDIGKVDIGEMKLIMAIKNIQLKVVLESYL